VRFAVPRLAIIVSATGSIASLEGTLLSVLENRPADCEIIVALNQAYADPYDLKGEVRFVDMQKGAAPIARLNRALATTRAPFVHLLASGCEVTEGWTEPALSRFGDRQIASVGPLIMDVLDRDRIFAVGVRYRQGGARVLVGRGATQLTPATESAVAGACGFAAFYRKAALDFVGGPSVQLGPRQADVDLAMVFERAGFGFALEPRSRVFAAPEADSAETPFAGALHEERLFWRNLPARGRAKAIVAHTGLVALEMVCSFARPRMVTQLAARALGFCQLYAYARHRQALEHLGQKAGRPKASREHLRVDAPHAPSFSDQAAARAPVR
jgi:hypothetical protein